MKRLGEDVKLRLLSVFIALILCIYVINIQNPEIKKEFEDIPVSIINLGYDLALANQYSYTTSVKVKGKQEIVKKLTKSDIEVVADLKSFNKVGKFSVPLDIKVQGAQGVEIIEGQPAKIEIALENLTSKSTTVDVKILGQKSDARYDIKSIRPNLVTISGPENLVRSIGAVRVFIDVTNHEKDISLIKNYRVIDKNNKDITDNASLIKDNQGIQVDIDYSKLKELPIVLNLTGEVARGYYISETKVSPDKVYVYGEPGKINNITEIKTSRLNITGLSRDLSKSLKLSIPDGIKTDFDDAVKVSIGVEKEEVKTLDIQSTNINFINTSDNYSYKMVKPKVSLQLIGRNGALNSVDVMKLGLYVNVQGLTPGDHNLPISMAPNSNIRLGDVNSTVKVRISEK